MELVSSGAYYGHDDAVDLPQYNLVFGVQLFACVLLDFEVQVCIDITHLLFGFQILPLMHTRWGGRRHLVRLLFLCHVEGDQTHTPVMNFKTFGTAFKRKSAGKQESQSHSNESNPTIVNGTGTGMCDTAFR